MERSDGRTLFEPSSMCERVANGLESAKAHRLVPANIVEAEFEARRAATKRRLAGSV
jgi:hypothetical protein